MYQIDFHHPIHIHFIGIGGISMSGLAEILLEDGFPVSGSDSSKSPLTEQLEKKGAVIFYGQRASNIHDNVGLVVYTAAIQKNNPEYEEALRRSLPTMTRAQLLGQIMKKYEIPIAVSGTHGKTTTTSMISQILLEENLDPTLSIGGILHSIGGNIRVGHSPYFVTEACEYTNSFLSFFPKIGIVLNIEEDHMDFFENISQIRDSFHKFASLLPQDGLLIINKEILQWEKIVAGLPCPVVTFGFDEDCDYFATNISFDSMAKPSFDLSSHGSIVPFTLNVPGRHNISNALASIALARELHISYASIQKALLHFSGTNRRFEWKGKVGQVSIIDDYAHHPTEIHATLSAALHYPHKSLWCVFQPHTYTRTKAFLKDFASSLSLADKIILTDIYAAREKDTLGISSKCLQKELEKLGCEVYYFPSFEEIENFLLLNCSPDDMLITMGAGDVNRIGERLLGQ
ncbi:UDP-N-acetylmuramate--L-alanine ligase [bacterium 1XD42-8]|nr:UDP-N-acetylmuramate--L-alanine ligase [bacterium 1XD42-8]